jgi:hypothetical protein
MLNKEPYAPPPAPFKVGSWVYFEERKYKVTACTHTHAGLQGLAWAVPVWQCSRKLSGITDSRKHRSK